MPLLWDGSELLGLADTGSADLKGEGQYVGTDEIFWEN
jgi:hypothetical protein